MQQFIIDISGSDVSSMLSDWMWIIPVGANPLFITAMGDWVFGNNDGSLSRLSVLDGTYSPIAKNSSEYNLLNKSEQWLNDTFSSDWFVIAKENGISPSDSECIGWKIHPALGGKFSVDNLQIFSMRVYQSLMGQLFQQLAKSQAENDCSAKKKPWFKLWQ